MQRGTAMDGRTGGGRCNRRACGLAQSAVIPVPARGPLLVTEDGLPGRSHGTSALTAAVSPGVGTLVTGAVGRRQRDSEK